MVNSDHVSLRLPRITLDNPVYLRNAMVDLLTRRSVEKEEKMTTEIVPVASAELVAPIAKMAPVEVDLDHLAKHYEAIVKGRRDIAEMEAYVAAMEDKFRTELAKHNATDAKISGRTVVTVRPADNFRYKEFEAAHPNVYRQYMKPVVVDKLDKAALRKEHGHLLEQYRTTVFNLK